MDINSSEDKHKHEEESNEEPHHLEQDVTHDVFFSGESLSDMNILGNYLNLDESNNKCYTEDAENDKDLSLSDDVALAGNAISAMGLSSTFNQTSLKYQPTSNTNNDNYNNTPNIAGANTMTDHKIRNKHSKLAGHIGSKNNLNYNQLSVSDKNTDTNSEMTDDKNNLQYLSNSDHVILKGDSNPVETELDEEGINQQRPIDWAKINRNSSVAEIV